MGEHKKAVIDIKSQDVKVPDLERYRSIVTSNRPDNQTRSEELIMFSVRSNSYKFKSLDELKGELDSIPEGATYLYYTISFGPDIRTSLYLDPDQPARVVIEGDEEWVDNVEGAIKNQFGKGGRRYLLHTRGGFLLLYGMVLISALIALTVVFFLKGEPDPVLSGVIVLAAGFIGIYISMIRMRINPANTVSFGKRMPWWLESLLYLITVILGIVCVILAAELIRLMF